MGPGLSEALPQRGPMSSQRRIHLDPTDRSMPCKLMQNAHQPPSLSAVPQLSTAV